MTKAWKIAPGSHADDWLLFRKNKCIGIGWLEDTDFRKFESVDKVLKALVSRYGENANGYGKGAAEMIWSFAREIKPGDLVVANDAYNRIVGIGVIESGYLHPRARSNPLRKDSYTHRHHVRLVDWQITRSVHVKGVTPKKYFFVQETLKELNSEDIKHIVNAYAQSHPSDIERTWAHLKARDDWDRPDGAEDDKSC